MSLSNRTTLFFITALTVDNRNIMVQTSDTHLLLSWDSITHSFIINLKNSDGSEKALFIMQYKHEKGIIYLAVDSSDLDDIKMVINGKILMSFISKKDINGLDSLFTDLITQINHNFTWTYIDPPLKNVIEKKKTEIPTVQNEQELFDYIVTAETKNKPEASAELLEKSIKEIKTFSGPVNTREEWSVGDLIDDRYEIQKILTGGMGVVYIVEDTERGKLYALKTFQEKYLFNSQVSSQFIKEAEIWIKLGKHQNIVQAERIIVLEGRPYIFLEYIDGTELEEKIKQASISIHDAIDYAIQFCEGMSYAFNQMQLVHRDIKPANCFIDKTNTLKITDFGLGKINYTPGTEEEAGMNASKTKDILASVAMVGTLPYMAPELFSDMKMASVQTDIYAFGIMFYEMLTGSNPFYDEDPSEVIDRHISFSPPPPSQKNQDIPPELDALIAKAIDKNPAQRYESFSAILNELSDLYKEHTGRELSLSDNETAFTEEDWLKTGLSLANLHNFKEAIRAYDEAINLNPRSPAIIHKGVALLAMEKFNEAINIFDFFSSLYPDYWKSWYYKSDALRLQKKYMNSIEALYKAESLKSDSAEILSKKAQIKAELGAINEALELFEKAIDIDNTIPEIWHQYGTYLMELKKYESAHEAFNEATTLNPRFTDAWYSRGRTFLHLGFHEEAIKAFGISLSIAPNFLESQIALGDTYYQLKNYKKAEEYYDNVLKKHQSRAAAIVGKLNVLAATGKDEQAVELAQANIGDSLYSAVIKEKLAEIFLNINQYKQSIEQCQDLLSLDKSNLNIDSIYQCAHAKENEINLFVNEINSSASVEKTIALHDFNSLLALTGGVEEAKNYLRLAYNNNPEDELNYLYFMTLLEKFSVDDSKAPEFFAKLQSKYPKSLQTKELGKKFFLKEKERNMSSLLGLKKNKKDGYDFLLDGLMVLKYKQYKAALSDFQSAYLNDRSLSSAIFFSALCLDNMGEKHKAKGMYEDFIRINPHSYGYYHKQIENIDSDAEFELETKETFYKKIIVLMPFLKECWLSYINFLLCTGQCEKAIIIAVILCDYYYDKLIEQNSEAQLLLRAYLCLLISRPLEARRLFEKIHAKNSANVLCTAGLARAMLLTGDGHKAEKLLSQADFSNNADEELFLNCVYSEILQTLNMNDQAVRRLDDIYKDSIPPTVKILQGRILRDSGEITLALNKANELSDKYGNLIPVIMLHQDLLMLKRQNPDPEKEYETKDCFSIKDRGLALLKTGNYISASETFRKISSINRFDFEASVYDGMVFYETSKFDLAADRFNEALQSNCRNEYLYCALGIVSYYKGELEKADDYFKEALFLNPTSAEILTNYSTFLIEKGDILDAQQCAEKALRLDGKYYDAWIARGRCLKTYGNLEDALSSAESALLIQPENIRGWLLKGSVLLESGDIQNSLQTLRRASEFDEMDASIWYNLGLITLMQGKKDIAFSYADKAIKRNPTMFETLMLYAVSHRMSGHTEKYQALTQKAQEANPVKFAKYKKIQIMKNNYVAPLKALDTITNPFKMDIIKKRKEYPLFRYMAIDTTVNIKETSS